MVAGRKKYWVVPSGGDWQVKHNGSVLSAHYTKPPAIESGRANAVANQPSQLLIMRTDGTIETEYTYGADPFPPRG